MTDYRCYFFGTDNRIVDRADFTADTDALAIIEARALYAEGESQNGFELWEQTRRVLYQEGSHARSSS